MSGESQNGIWPLPKFHFSVNFGSTINIAVMAVTGLETETQLIEYRAGNSNQFSPIKMPGLLRVGKVTFKKGIFVNDNTFWQWYNKIQMNTIARETVVINLLDETGASKREWVLNNAWPTKIVGPDLDSEGNEVAVESIEVAFETLTISAP